MNGKQVVRFSKWTWLVCVIPSFTRIDSP